METENRLAVAEGWAGLGVGGKLGVTANGYGTSFRKGWICSKLRLW